MAGNAILRRGFVEEHGFGIHSLRQLVTVATLNVLMSAAQREHGSLLVVEERRLPLHAVVAVSTGCGVSLGELLSMNVFMAILAQQRCGFEIDIDELGFEVRWLVTIDAGGRTMSPEQRELCFRMVESGQFFPRFGRMACFAAKWLSVGADLLHAVLELTFVNVFMTTGAVEIVPVINH